MIIYLATREVFLQHVREQRIEEEVRERYIAITGHKVAANEFRAWQTSLQCVGHVLQFSQLEAVHVQQFCQPRAQRFRLVNPGVTTRQRQRRQTAAQFFQTVVV